MPNEVHTKAVETIIDRHNAELPTYKHIAEVSIRSIPFVKTTSNKIIRQAFFDKRKNEDNLYSCGLDSLSTLELSVCIGCPPTTIYENKTIRKIAKHIGIEKEEETKQINEQLKEKNINEEITNAKKVPFDDSGAFCVTGVTGFLGPHIIKELSKTNNTIICLTRNEERFQNACKYYYRPDG